MYRTQNKYESIVVSTRKLKFCIEFLLKIGNGHMSYNHWRVNLGNQYICISVNDLQQLVNNVCPEINNIVLTITWFKMRAILSPINNQVGKVNVKLIHRRKHTTLYTPCWTRKGLYISQQNFSIVCSLLDCPHIN